MDHFKRSQSPHINSQLLILPMTSTADLVLRVHIRMRKRCLIFALQVVCSPCVHTCAHVKRVNIIAVRNHLREEDTSPTVPIGHHDLVNHAAVASRTAIFPFIRRILFFDGVDIGESANFVPHIPAGVNQINLDTSFCLYLKHIMGALKKSELLSLQLRGDYAFIDIFRDVACVRLTDNDLNLVLDDHKAFNLTAVLHLQQLARKKYKILELV